MEKKQSARRKISSESQSLPIIGIGASAGDLEAFEKFFTQLPPDAGMAFVIVQHPDPTQESIPPDLLKKFTHISVTPLEDQTVVEPNRVYVIPPNTDLNLQGGRLQLVTSNPSDVHHQQITSLKQELKSTQESLQASIDELKSANKALQSLNDGLQSANKELVTLNTKLQTKVDELASASNDIKNLMENTQVGLIFLDTQLCIRRFTQASKQMVDLTPEDIGRPINQFVHKLRYERLIQDAQETFKTQTAREVEVQAESGAWYLLRFIPYRTGNKQVSGLVLTLVDITQVKQAGAPMRPSEERLRWVSPNTTDHILIQDLDLHYEFVTNPQLGLTEKDMLGKTDYDFLPKEEADNLTRIKKQVLESGQPIHLEVPVRSRDGVQGYFDGAYIPKFDLAGKVTGLVGYFKDVTNRKQVEEKLQQSEERFSKLFQSSPVAASLTRLADNVFVDVNESFMRLFEYSREELIGHTPFDLNFFPDKERVAAAQEHVLEHPNVNNFEIPVKAKSGKVHFVIFSTERIQFDNDAHQITTMVDITDRKQAEEKLRQSEARYRAVVENQTEFIVRWKPDGTRTFVNEAYLRYFGLTYEQAIANDFMQLVAEPHRQAIKEKTACLVSGYADLETDVHQELLPNGKMTWQEWTDIAIRDDAGNLIEFQSVGRDITERKKSEETIRTQAEVAKNMAEGAYIVDQHETIIRWASPRFEEMFGYAPGEMLGKHVAIVNAPGDLSAQEKAKEILETILRGGEWHGEIKNIKKDGTQFWCYASVSAFEHPIYGPVFLSIHTDITERKQAEQELQFQAEILKAVGQAIIATDLDGKVIYSNLAAEKLYGWAQAELIGKNIVEVAVPQISQAQAQEIMAHLSEGNSWYGEFLVQRRDGTVFPSSIHDAPLFDRRGRLIGVLGISFDITDRRRAEDAVRKSEAQFRAVIDSSPIPYALNDDKQNITYLNPAFVNTFGYDLDDIPTLAEWWPRAYPDLEYRHWVTETWREHLARATANTSAVEPLEVNIQCKDGSFKTALVGAASLGESLKDTHLVILYDITDRKQAEEEIQRLYAQAQEDARVKSDLLNEVNHRVKNNLMRIQSLLHLKSWEFDVKTREKDLLLDMQTRVGSMLAVHTMLSDSLWSPLALGDLCKQVIQSVLSTSPLKANLVFEVSFQPEACSEQMIIPGQATTLALILNELAMNSIKYAFHGRTSGNIQLAVTLNIESNLLSLVFRDDGAGWPEDVISGKREGLGLRLIRASLQSLPKSNLQMANDGGAVTTVAFKLAHS